MIIKCHHLEYRIVYNLYVRYCNNSNCDTVLKVISIVVPGSDERGRVPGGGQQRHIAAVRRDHRAVERLQVHVRRQVVRAAVRGAAPGAHTPHSAGRQ